MAKRRQIILKTELKKKLKKRKNNKIKRMSFIIQLFFFLQLNFNNVKKKSEQQ